jgi:hypothetical protein
LCEGCGRDVPIRRVALNRHIGAFVVMFHVTYDAFLCKRCISTIFWRYTPVTLLLGWWGILSVIITPLVVLNNLFTYIRSLFMPATYVSKVGRMDRADVSA